jgi:hypothetical protein
LKLGSNGSNSRLEKKNYPILAKNQAKTPAIAQKPNNCNFRTPKLNYADILYNSGANVRQTKTSTAKLITHQTLPHNPSLNSTTNRASTRIGKDSWNFAYNSKAENPNPTGNLCSNFMRKNNSITCHPLLTVRFFLNRFSKISQNQTLPQVNICRPLREPPKFVNLKN